MSINTRHRSAAPLPVGINVKGRVWKLAVRAGRSAVESLVDLSGKGGKREIVSIHAEQAA
jgi:hypothetical protein